MVGTVKAAGLGEASKRERKRGYQPKDIKGGNNRPASRPTDFWEA